jgi:hypothetical protein
MKGMSRQFEICLLRTESTNYLRVLLISFFSAHHCTPNAFKSSVQKCRGKSHLQAPFPMIEQYQRATNDYSHVRRIAPSKESKGSISRNWSRAMSRFTELQNPLESIWTKKKMAHLFLLNYINPKLFLTIIRCSIYSRYAWHEYSRLKRKEKKRDRLPLSESPPPNVAILAMNDLRNQSSLIM